uniref:Endonuclease/exonuclease/phosphatase domain-containing protein n=2 Tax=Helobdella robusta TaxID=6412 RepID=T1FKZ1_HELRO
MCLFFSFKRVRTSSIDSQKVPTEHEGGRTELGQFEGDITLLNSAAGTHSLNDVKLGGSSVSFFFETGRHVMTLMPLLSQCFTIMDKVDKFDVVKQFRLSKKTEKTRPLLVRLKSNGKNYKLDADGFGRVNGDADETLSVDNDLKLTVHLGLLNIRSILSKFNVIFGLISEGLDIFVVAETWHGSSDSLSVGLSLPPGYRFIDAVRAGDPFHGGLIIFLGPSCKYRRIVVPTVTTFEVLAVKLIIDRQDFILLAVYRPGSVQPSVLFFKELTVVLDSITVLNSRIVLAGDFNIHVERGSDTHAATLGDIFENYCLVNHTKEPTHILGGTLDLVVTSVDFPVIDCKVKGQECPGSFKAADQPPAGSSASARPPLTAAPVINPHVATRGSSASVSESPSQVDFFHVFDRLTVVLRTAHLYDHVPKPCRDKVSKALSALLTAVCDDPCDATHWCRLQCFFAFVLFKPTRGGRRTNQANYVIKRLAEFSSTEVEFIVASFNTDHNTKPRKHNPNSWISAVTTRIEQGSLSAAVRLACSPAGLAESSPETLAKLKAIHPSAPLNRRAFPAQEPSNGRVSPAQVLTALKSFNNGSSGGLDGLRPQHIKDLLSGPTPTDELLNNLT